MLHGRRRDDQRIALGADAQPDIHELIGEQGIIVVVKPGLQTHRTCCDINLVVDGLKRALCQLAIETAIKSINLQCLATAEPFKHGRQLGLGQGKKHRYRLSLCNNDQALGTARRNQVALVNNPQPQPAADRRSDF